MGLEGADGGVIIKPLQKGQGVEGGGGEVGVGEGRVGVGG